MHQSRRLVQAGHCRWLGIIPTLASLSLLLPLSGQNATSNATASGKPPAEEVIELPIWEVPASKEGDYRNPQSVTATRIVADIKDIPLTVNVVGEEFLRDNGTQEFIDAFRYTPNISVQPDTLVSASPPIKIRGFNSSLTLRNGFTKYYQQNIDGVDRLEIVRGPVATFYGRVNDPGGVINYITKRPLFDWRHTFKVQYGSNSFYKAWVDSTGPIWKDKIAFRVVSTYQNNESWKDYVTNERTYFLGNLTIRPVRNVEILLEYEYNKANANGGINTALVQNEDYTAEYAQWQAQAATQEWYKQINSKNSGTTPAAFFKYNADFTTRYPRVYPASLFAGTDRTNVKRYYPWLVDDYARDFVDQDPRTGAAQEPILNRDSDIGTWAGGLWAGPRNNNTVTELRKYRYGWRMIKFMESLGAYKDGQFVRNDAAIPSTGTAPSEGAYPPALTGNVFPLGYSYNPNGPGAWNFDESHVASAELRWKILENLSFRYGLNYYENQSRNIQQYNSDTDMDGYTLEPRQGISDRSTIPQSGTVSGFTGFNWFNTYWTHQGDLSFDFEIGETKHSILATAEYRHDAFIARAPGAVPPLSDKGSSSYPGYGLIDIGSEPMPPVNEFYGESVDAKGVVYPSWWFRQESIEMAQGYGVSYRGKFFQERLHAWAGLRHESWKAEANTTTDPLAKMIPTTKTNGTTPMYGASYRIMDGVSLYASYSESFKPLNKVTNVANRDPDNLDDPTAKLPVSSVTNPKGLGYEVGLKGDLWDGKLVTSVAVFHVEKKGEIFQDTGLQARLQQIYDDYTTANNLERITANAINVNGGLEETEGLEIDSLLTMSRNWQISSSFSWNWLKEISQTDPKLMYGDTNLPPGVTDGPYPHPSLFIWDDTYGGYRPKTPDEKKDAIVEVYPEKRYKELANVPDFTFTLWSKYSFEDGWAKGGRVGGGYRFESKSNVDQSRDRPWQNPALHLVDLMVGYEMPLGKGTLDFAVNVRNVFDKVYTKGSFGIFEPRSISFTAEYRF